MNTRHILLTFLLIFGLSGVVSAETRSTLSERFNIPPPEPRATLFEKTREMAEQGDMDAQLKLGTMYLYGDSIPENEARAFKWYQKAAEQGHVVAMVNLATLYGVGRIMPENETEAIKWYRKAAEQGYANAQYALGNRYQNGEGIPANNIKAYAWYSLASVQKHEGALKSIDILKKELTREQIAKAQEMASKCFESNYKDCD